MVKMAKEEDMAVVERIVYYVNSHFDLLIEKTRHKFHSYCQRFHNGILTEVDVVPKS